MINDLEDVLKTVFRTRQAKPSEVLSLDLKALVYEVYGIPSTVRSDAADAWIKVRDLLEEGTSYGEAARSAGVSRKTVAKWFPDLGWEPTGGSSSFIRKGEIAVKRAVGEW